MGGLRVIDVKTPLDLAKKAPKSNKTARIILPGPHYKIPIVQCGAGPAVHHGTPGSGVTQSDSVPRPARSLWSPPEPEPPVPHSRPD